MTAQPEPKPDPTRRTIETLHREITMQSELFDVRLGAFGSAHATMDRTVESIPSEIARAIGHLRELMEEKFRSVDKQFGERDTRSEREARDNKLAVDAAFAAQEKQAVAQNESNALAINKSESATTETIKTNQDLASSQTQSLVKTVDELKLQVNTLITGGTVSKDVRVERQANTAQTIALAGVVCTLVGGSLAAILIRVFGG
jgi:hypothetical protein